MCSQFVRGNCTRGNSCKFAHDERYKSQAKKRLDGRKSFPRKKGRGKGRGKGKGRGRPAGAVVDGKADGEDNEEEEPEYIDVDMDLPAEEEDDK